MSFDLLFAWLMVMLRATSIVVVLPSLGAKPFPVTLRVGFAMCVATLLYGIVPHAALGGAGWGTLAYAAGGEVLIGLAMGFVGRLVFSAVEMGGRIIVTEIGLTGGPGFDIPTPDTEPVPAFLSMFAGMLFFLFGGHLAVLHAFARSFYFAAAGAPVLSSDAADTIVRLTADSVDLGVRIAAPFLALNFLTNLGFSILGRAVPKMGVFILSYPVRVIVGMLMFAGSGALFSRYFFGEFDALPWRMLQLVAVH